MVNNDSFIEEKFVEGAIKGQNEGFISGEIEAMIEYSYL